MFIWSWKNSGTWRGIAGELAVPGHQRLIFSAWLIVCLPAGRRGGITRIYHSFIGNTTSCEMLIDGSKRMIVDKHLAGDIDNLAHLLKRISERYRYASDFTLYGLQVALIEILVLFPVYRTTSVGPAPAGGSGTYPAGYRPGQAQYPKLPQ